MAIPMEGYDSRAYGDAVADLYDDWSPGVLTTTECVERLVELAGTGPVLELGVGTGRLAIPLAGAGLAVEGIDSSAAMLERLAAKPGGGAVATRVCDMADVDAAANARYALVLVAADTLFMLPSQDEQVRCFANVARRLLPGGVFVVEAFVPDRTRHAGGQDVVARRVSADSLLLGATLHDPVRQRLDAQQVLLTPAGIRMVPGSLRYAWPAELDLMARLAGLRLRERWGGWRRQPFTADSRSHVSLYEIPPAAGQSGVRSR
ncbi:MAG TPA: class I SAM-dependent methyltransferase [Candidatus Dormibacteraeota bacterium]